MTCLLALASQIRTEPSALAEARTVDPGSGLNTNPKIAQSWPRRGGILRTDAIFSMVQRPIIKSALTAAKRWLLGLKATGELALGMVHSAQVDTSQTLS